MTREEAKDVFLNRGFIEVEGCRGRIFHADKWREACVVISEWLEQESKTEQFAKWVATEIFDDMWEYNKDAFAEIACRKLAKLGIVRANGDEWELVESQKSEVEK